MGRFNSTVFERARPRFRLSGTVHNPCCTVPKRRSDAIRSDNRRIRKTGGIEIPSQFRFQRPSVDQLVFRACSSQLCPVFAYPEDVVGISVRDRESVARLNRKYTSKVPASQKRSLEPG